MPDVRTDSAIEPDCRRVCPHIVDCGFGTLRECQTGCEETEAAVTDAECRVVFRELIGCIGGLECDEIPASIEGEPLYERTRCRGLLFEFLGCVE